MTAVVEAGNRTLGFGEAEEGFGCKNFGFVQKKIGDR